MPAVDFREVALPTSGPERDRFELFARDVLDLLGFKVLQGPDRGADGGRDLIVEERRTGVAGETLVRWLVSCKHKAHSGASVSPADEPDIHDRLNAHRCTGFLGFYSTIPSGGLTAKISGAADKFESLIFDPERIERMLLGSADGIQLAKRYFPESIAKWQASDRGAAKIFVDPVDIICDYCGKSLLSPEPHGIVTLWRKTSEKGVDRRRTEHVYFACKGHCDRCLRAPLLSKRMIDGWEDISDLAIPTLYIRWVMSTLNQLHENNTYADEAFDKIKDLYINLFPIICRHPSEEDRERVKSLLRFPGFLGGLGT